MFIPSNDDVQALEKMVSTWQQNADDETDRANTAEARVEELEAETDKDANLRLRSAAPDLLEACKQALEVLTGGVKYHGNGNVDGVLRAAINKAMGKD